MNYVVGSGPAGVAAAVALAQKGLPVTVLDVGGELAPEIQTRVARLGARDDSAWTSEERRAVQGELRYNSEGTPLKLHFGSDYAYRDVERLEPTERVGVDVYRGFAKGGLSTLWGASVLPYNAEDLAGWPIGVGELAPHYQAVLGLTGVSGERDELDARYPLYVEPDSGLRPSRQARQLLDRMRSHNGELQKSGIYFGRSRLAIRARGTRGCAHCGMCLYGCPYNLIYSSRDTLAANPSIKYEAGVFVRRIRESAQGVEIEATTRDGSVRRFAGERVFLAAGTYSSTRILLESMDAYDRPVSFKQSDHFLIPLLLRASAGDVTSEKLHTLSQVYLGFVAGQVAEHPSHLQIYTYNDYMAAMARGKLGPLYPLLQPLFRALYGRVAVAKGYFHSADSTEINARLIRSSGTPTLRLTAEGQGNARLRQVVRALRGRSRELGFYPVGLAAKMGHPGSGVHVGGSWPMAANPVAGQSDRLGRPHGWQRLHVVDSTIFPSIPASTITLTAMANAHRIASLV